MLVLNRLCDLWDSPFSKQAREILSLFPCLSVSFSLYVKFQDFWWKGNDWMDLGTDSLLGLFHILHPARLFQLEPLGLVLLSIYTGNWNRTGNGMLKTVTGKMWFQTFVFHYNTIEKPRSGTSLTFIFSCQISFRMNTKHLCFKVSTKPFWYFCSQFRSRSLPSVWKRTQFHCFTKK